MGTPAKLVWQCRRGVKELDLLLQGYLSKRYQQADDAEKNLFSQLLQLEDGVLSAMLLSPANLQNCRYRHLVQKIKANPLPARVP